MKLIEISDEVSYEFDGHIPGAVPAGKEYWREQGDDGVPHPPADRASCRSACGPWASTTAITWSCITRAIRSTRSRVTFYAYWIFDLLGRDAVSILDGGWHAWQAAGGETDEAKVRSDTGGLHGPSQA